MIWLQFSRAISSGSEGISALGSARAGLSQQELRRPTAATHSSDTSGRTETEPGPNDAAAQPDEDEDIQTKAFPVDDLRRFITIGEIVDMKTVAGLALL